MQEEFWIIIAGTAAAAVATMVKYCFRSKCSKISSPCLTIERDVDAEEKESEQSNNRSLSTLNISRV